MPLSHRPKSPTAPIKQQVAGKAKWNESRLSEADFFTLGYSGRKTGEILEALKRHGVKTVLDVRQNPVSRFRPEMSKANFRKLLEQNDIQYAHAPELGVPSQIRTKAVEAGTRDVIWAWYDKNVITSHLNLHTFLNGFEKAVAFMCTEIDPHDCHRHRLALALEAMGLNGFDL